MIDLARYERDLAAASLSSDEARRSAAEMLRDLAAQMARAVHAAANAPAPAYYGETFAPSAPYRSPLMLIRVALDGFA